MNKETMTELVFNALCDNSYFNDNYDIDFSDSGNEIFVTQKNGPTFTITITKD